MANNPTAPTASAKKENKKAKAPPAIKPTVYYKGADVDQSEVHGVPALGIFLVWAPINQDGLTLPPAAGVGGSGSGGDGAAGSSSGASATPDLTAIGDLTIGFVDGWGYLQNVVPGRNPWVDVFKQLENRAAAPAQTASQPMAEGLTYRIWPVAHPHPDRAQAALHHLRALKQQQLDAQKAKKDEKNEKNGKAAPTATAPPPKPPPVAGGPPLDFSKLKSFDLKLERKKEGKVDILPIYLPVTADAYWPGGSPKYGNWLLYRNMPYAALPEVRKQVRLASFHLGALRYPTGSEHSPYLDNKSEGTLGDHPGWYSNTMVGSVDHLQKAVVTGEAFKMASAPMPRKQEHRTSCAFLLGQDVTLVAAPSGAPPPGGPPAAKGTLKVDHKLKDGDFFPGVLDAPTAEVLHEWIAKGLRHRGDLLVVLKGDVWGQSPMVFAYWAWDALVKALECPYGLGISNTWRPFSTTPGAGQTDASNHALGLAIDLACSFDEDYTDQTSSRDRWFPVAFEALWIREPQAAERQLDTHKANLKRVEGKFKDGAPAPKDTDTKISETRTALDTAKKAKSLGATALQNDLKLLQELKQARDSVAAAQRKVDELMAVIAPWKLEYELRFRLYGHTKLDALNLSTKDLLEKLTKAFGAQPSPPATPVPGPAASPAPEGGSSGYSLVDSYRAQLVGMFPQGLSVDLAKARDAIIGPYVAKLKAAVEHLLALAKQQGADTKLDRSAFVDAFIRKTVRPFRSDGWSQDGGDSLPAVEASKDAEDATVQAKFPELKTTAKAWLNISRLGWHLDMGNISSRNKDFKRAWNHPQLGGGRKTLETLTVKGQMPTADAPPDDPYKDHTRRGALRRLALAIRKVQADAPDFALTIKDTEEKEHAAKDFTEAMVALMESWPPPADKLTEGLTIDNLDLIVKVSGEAEKRAEQATAVAEIFAAGQARVISIGKNLTTDLKADAIVEGSVLEAGIKEATIVPPEAPPDAAKGKVEGAVKGKKSELKLIVDQTLRLRPALAPKAPDLWNARIILPAAGSPKGLEWWHFEHRHRTGPWVANMARTGVSKGVLTAPREPGGLDGIVVPGPEIGPGRGDYPFPLEPGNEPPTVPEGG